MSSKNTWQQWLDDDADLPSAEKFIQRHDRHKVCDDNFSHKRIYQDNDAFRCCHCKAWVESDPEVCGVKHRNHCPYCLFSKHVDDQKTGDRCSDCQSAMRPVGLTFKETPNKYSRGESGELMLIHLCLGCGKLSINRIAADDNAERILAIFNESGRMELSLRARIARDCIRLGGRDDLNMVLTRLYGVGERACLGDQDTSRVAGTADQEIYQDQDSGPLEGDLII